MADDVPHIRRVQKPLECLVSKLAVVEMAAAKPRPTLFPRGKQLLLAS